jgi:cholesterol transport system auxiliary component
MNLLRLACALAVSTLCACSALRPEATPQRAFYTLDSASSAALAGATSARVAMVATRAPTLLVNPPHAAAGFDSPHIIYVREAHKLEHFAHSDWIEPPARMLAPLIVAAVEESGAFRAVVATPSPALGDLRLDTEIIRLQHDFQVQPSQARFTLRAYLVEVKTRRVLASREFDRAIAAAGENPYAGVVAANLAVRAVLADLVAFCAEAATAAAPTRAPSTP